MEVILFILPFIVALFLLLFFRKETKWWEYVVLIGPSLVLFLLIKLVMVQANQTDIEYLGNYITKVRHYDEWDEWVHRTCTRTYKSGNTTRTQVYDCSYRRYHPEKWTYFDSKGDEYPVYYEEDFNLIRNKLNSPMVFVDMNRDYHRIDGDAQDYYWKGTRETCYTVTEPHSYKNKIQKSKSVFGFEEISKKDAAKIGLYDYPYIEHNDQLSVLSDSVKIDESSIDAVKYINGMYGEKHQFRLYLLLFKDKDIEISEQQRSYWVGGNKNELVVCLGVDENKQVKWCNAFSWCDAPTLEVKTESYFADKDTLNVIEYTKYVEELLEDGEWVRKEFSDFDYIRAELSSTQELWLLILVGLYNIGISIFIILNNYRNENF